MEVVPDCSRLNWRVISNRQPPRKLAPVRTGEPSREWGGSEASPPPPGPCAWAGYPLSPPPRGAVGERNAARFFLQHLSPPVGACGERNYALFFWQLFQSKSKVGIPTLLPKTPIQAIFFHQKRAGVATRQIWRMMTPPQNALNLIKTGPLPQLTRFGE